MLHTLAEKVDPRHAALLVVDVQNDFCHEDGASAKNGWDVRPAQAMIPTLKRLIDECRGAGLPVIFVRVTHSPENDSDVWRERQSDRPHYICREGSWGAEWYGIEPRPEEPVVVKHRYSAFVGTNLDELLRERGIQSLIITGTTTDRCCETAARDGFMRDYYIVFVSDCTAAPNPEYHRRTLGVMAEVFGVVASADEVIAAMQPAQARMASD